MASSITFTCTRNIQIPKIKDKYIIYISKMYNIATLLLWFNYYKISEVYILWLDVASLNFIDFFITDLISFVYFAKNRVTWKKKHNGMTIYFRWMQIKTSPYMNALISDICIGTSAAPTYFPAHHFTTTDDSGQSSDFNLIDGGVAANNPVYIYIY